MVFVINALLEPFIIVQLRFVTIFVKRMKFTMLTPQAVHVLLVSTKSMEPVINVWLELFITQ